MMMKVTSLFLTTSFVILALLAIVAQARPLRGVSSTDLSLGVIIISIYGNPDQTGEITIPAYIHDTCTSEKPCKQEMMSSNYDRRPPKIPPPSPKSSPPTEEITFSSSTSSNGKSRPPAGSSTPPSPKPSPSIGQLGLASEKPCKQEMISSNYEMRPTKTPPPSPKSSPPSSPSETTFSSSTSSNGKRRPPAGPSTPPSPKPNPSPGQLGLAASSSPSSGDDCDHGGSSTTSSTPSDYISMRTHKDLTTADTI